MVDTPLENRRHFRRTVLIIGAIALFTGFRFESDALFGIGVTLLSAYFLIWLLWRFTFYRLTSRIDLDEIRGFEGEEIGLTLVTSNQKLLPLFWLNITYELPAGLYLKEVELTLNPATERANLRSFWSIGAYQTRKRRFTIVCKTRGTYIFGPMIVESGDPFGFFSGKKTIQERTPFLIYPAIYSMEEIGLPANVPFGDARSQGRLFEDPLRTIGVREWAQGDPMRKIHWKATAKHQALHSRIYEPVEEEQILIILNVATLERHWHGYFPELQEQVIRVASSLAYQIAELRLPVGLIANGHMPGSNVPIRLMPGRAPDQLTHILELLSSVTSMSTGAIDNLILQESPRIPLGTTLVVVTAVSSERLLALLEDLAAAGRSIVLISLAKEPPQKGTLPIDIYHLPQLSTALEEDLSRFDDVVKPVLVT